MRRGAEPVQNGVGRAIAAALRTRTHDTFLFQFGVCGGWRMLLKSETVELAVANKMVPGPGLEPGYSASKADVLPIRRSRNYRDRV